MTGKSKSEDRIGTPFTPHATRLLLLGSGELGKEVAIEAQRLGLEVIAVDGYPNAPAMQVADRARVINMLDPVMLRAVIEAEKPDYIVPEIEAIATGELIKLEQEGWNVVPTARAANLTMDREGIRCLAAEALQLPTSPYRFANTLAEVRDAVSILGVPCVIKPVMSSSGKGQSVIRSEADIEAAWAYSQDGGRSGAGRVIVEGFVDFDYEITLLTVRHVGGTSFCAPIGHRQEDGDYRESWQPQKMTVMAQSRAEAIAESITSALKGYGVFGVELFVKGDEVWFSEVSPRPHDTGMVTMVSQDLSQFALHVRAILGQPVPAIQQLGPAASAAVLVEGELGAPVFEGARDALATPGTQLRLFGKPGVNGRRRMGVALALGTSIDRLDEVKARAMNVRDAVQAKPASL
ncbi:MAG: formate-dependent phosphoribosylglycinamide formyltransferase [Pseudomonadota bacterium]|nr:formate-dependent phosphoribosylglycinamide formyltransferase [Pseudomonadota bacterium]